MEFNNLDIAFIIFFIIALGFGLINFGAPLSLRGIEKFDPNSKEMKRLDKRLAKMDMKDWPRL